MEPEASLLVMAAAENVCDEKTESCHCKVDDERAKDELFLRKVYVKRLVSKAILLLVKILAMCCTLLGREVFVNEPCCTVARSSVLRRTDVKDIQTDEYVREHPCILDRIPYVSGVYRYFNHLYWFLRLRFGIHDA
jgi:hypothetical protein